jgi:hypothetical protein
MFALVKFHSYRKQEFTPWWWIWLAATGISIGCVCSVKWVGMLGTAVVGLYTIEDLWNKFGEKDIVAVYPVPVDLIIAKIHSTLGRACTLFDCSADPGLYVLVLGPFLDSLQFRSWRRSDVVSLPSEPQRIRVAQLTP